MWDKLEKARKKLEQEGVSSVILRENGHTKATDASVKTLVGHLKNDPTYLNGTIVADKIVGKAKALLCVLGGADGVYGHVMSQGAIGVFEENDMSFVAHQTVPFIENADKSGVCRYEETVKDISCPTLAFAALEKTLVSY